MTALFSHPSPPSPVTVPAAAPSVTPTTPPTPASSSVQNAGQMAALALGSGAGTSSTILTSGLGASGNPITQQKRLLGG